MHRVWQIKIKGSETSITIPGWTCDEGGRDKPRGSSLLITFSASPRVSAPYPEAGLQVCSHSPRRPPVAARGVLAAHLGLSQLSTVALHEGSSPLAQDPPRDGQRQKGYLGLFCPSTAFKNKANHDEQTSKSHSPQLEPPTLPGHGSRLTKVKCSQAVRSYSSNSMIWDYVNSVLRAQGAIHSLLPKLQYWNRVCSSLKRPEKTFTEERKR